MTANHDIAVAIRLLFCITASTSMNDFAIPFRTTCVEDPLPKILLHSEWIMENDQLFWRQTYLSGRVKKLLVCAGLFHSWSGRKLKECFARACGAQPRTHIDELNARVASPRSGASQVEEGTPAGSVAAHVS